MKRILPQHPESYRQLLRRSLFIYRESFSHVFFLACLLSICVFLPRFISIILNKDFSIFFRLFSPYLILWFLIGLMGLTCFIAIIWRLHCINRGVDEPFIEDFSIGLKKVLTVFIASIIQSFLIFGLTIVIFAVEAILHRYHLLFPQNLLGVIFSFIIFSGQFFLTLYVTTLFLFLVPLIAIENQGVFASLERSIYLVWDNWWRVFSLQITPWLAYLILFLILRFILKIDIRIYFLDTSDHLLWTIFLQFLIFILFIPWVAALLLVQLKDLELRKHIRQTAKNAL